MVLADAINRAASVDANKIQAALAATQMSPEVMIMPWEGVQFDKNGQNTLTRGIFVQNSGGVSKLIWPFDQAAADLTWPRPNWR